MRRKSGKPWVKKMEKSIDKKKKLTKTQTPKSNRRLKMKSPITKMKNSLERFKGISEQTEKND